MGFGGPRMTAGLADVNMADRRARGLHQVDHGRCAGQAHRQYRDGGGQPAVRMAIRKPDGLADIPDVAAWRFMRVAAPGWRERRHARDDPEHHGVPR